jgi:hypothetical protein
MSGLRNPGPGHPERVREHPELKINWLDRAHGTEHQKAEDIPDLKTRAKSLVLNYLKKRKTVPAQNFPPT